jgi:predicted Rossmann fold flavoprotein
MMRVCHTRAMDERFDVVVLGAGAAGMMCAIEAGKRGRRVLVIDHAKAAGEKIRISGGGRCNFTNIHTAPDRFLSANPSFCISALRRYRPQDFIALVDAAGIAWHEKTLGQLFCDGSAQQIVELLLQLMRKAGAELRLGVSAADVRQGPAGGFELMAGGRRIACEALVVATGGKSIPKMGATAFGYDLARQFGAPVTETRPALVPLTFETGLLERTAPLAGVSTAARVKAGKTAFEEALLFTHRGLSGPVILQASSYWREGQAITLDLAPGADIAGELKTEKRAQGGQSPVNVLARHLPRRLAQWVIDGLAEGAAGNLADLPDARLMALGEAVNRWTVKPVGSEGYRTAEVTLGGVDTRALSSRTLMAEGVPGLHFIGEVVDVTGWLGGYNFQWAWASGWCAGQSV